jgi:DNA modification methylase
MRPYYEHAGITIYHGDCREVMPARSADVLVTDPPYGMNYNTDGNRFTKGGGRHLPRVRGDDEPFDPVRWSRYRDMILWGFNHYCTTLPPGGALVWIKRSDAAFGCALSDCELAWIKGRQGVFAFRNIAHSISSQRQHPAEKPLDLMIWCLSFVGDGVIFDPFMGSGTTLVAAKRLGREAIGIEIEERYCELAAERLSQEPLPFEPLPLAAQLELV